MPAMVKGWVAKDRLSGKARGSSSNSRGRSFIVCGLVVVASFLAVLSILAVWVNRQLLNTEDWTRTNSHLLENSEIRNTLADFLVEQAYTNLNAEQQFNQQLPKNLKILAGPVSNTLRQTAIKTTRSGLESERFQTIWREANRLTHKQFVAAVEGKNAGLRVAGSAVVLDLRKLVIDVVLSLGLANNEKRKTSPNTGVIKLLSSEQLERIRGTVKGLRAFALFLPFFSLSLFIFATVISKDRRRAITYTGVGLTVAGLSVLFARNLLGDYTVDTLTTGGRYRPAAYATWNIATSLLAQIATTTAVAGTGVALYTSILGRSRTALLLRKTLAQPLHRHPVAPYTISFVGLLAVMTWKSTDVSERPVGVAVTALLFFAAVAVLHRQTVREFPRR